MAKLNEQEPTPIPIPNTPGWRLTKAIHQFLDPGFVHRPHPDEERAPWGILAEDPLVPFPAIIEQHLPQWEPDKYFFDQAEEIAAAQHPILDIPNPNEARIPESYLHIPVQMGKIGFARTIDYDIITHPGNIGFGIETAVVQYNTYYYPAAPGDALFSVGRLVTTQDGSVGPVVEGREALVTDTSDEALVVAQYLEDHMSAYFGRSINA